MKLTILIVLFLGVIAAIHAKAIHKGNGKKGHEKEIEKSNEVGVDENIDRKVSEDALGLYYGNWLGHRGAGHRECRITKE